MEENQEEIGERVELVFQIFPSLSLETKQWKEKNLNDIDDIPI